MEGTNRLRHGQALLGGGIAGGPRSAKASGAGRVPGEYRTSAGECAVSLLLGATLACLKGVFINGCFLDFQVLRAKAPFSPAKIFRWICRVSSTRSTRTDS